MLKYFAVAAVLAAVAAAQGWPNTTMAPSSSTISIYECASSACQSGSCSLVNNIPQHQCIPLNNGMGQRAHCVNLPKARCIRESLYMGRICNQTSVLLDTTRRCGACEPAPEGWGIIDCSTRDVVYRYGCDGRCGNCTKKISARVGECGHANIGGGNVTFTVNAIVNCKSLIYYQNYADSQCTQPQGNVSTAIAGMECLGFDSNGQPAGAVEYQCNNDGAATAAKFNGKGIKSM